MTLSPSLLATTLKGVNAKNVNFLILDGKRVRLLWTLFVPAYFGLLLDKHELRYKYNIGSKIIMNTFDKAKEVFPKALDKFVRTKYSIYRRHNNVSYKGAPRPLIDKVYLLSLINQGLSKVEIQNRLGISEFLFHRNLEWHNIREVWYETRNKYLVKGLQQDYVITRYLTSLFPGFIEDLSSNVLSIEQIRRMLKVHCEIQMLASYIKNLGCISQKKVSPRAYSFTTNLGEVLVARYLLFKEIDFKQQYIIGPYMYDFYLTKSHTIVEVDGSSHRIRGNKFNKNSGEEYDRKREQFVRAKGYNFLRLEYKRRKVLDLDKLNLYAA